jgi:hypothetical protein
VNRDLVFQRHHPQQSTSHLRNRTPEAKTVMFLGLGSEGVFDHANAPLFLDIGPLSQNFVLKIVGESVGRHKAEDNLTIGISKVCRLTASVGCTRC